MGSSDNEYQHQRLVIVGARSNLTQAIQNKSDATVISTGEMLNPDSSISVAKNLPVIINAFQPATQLSDLSDPVTYLERSLMVLARSLNWARSAHCSRLIYTSSAVVYGNNSDSREDDAVQIHGLHSALKVAAEQLVVSYATESGFDYTIVRLFNLFGGQDQFSVIYRLEQSAKSGSPFRLINSGEAVRDFTHVTDAANSYLQLLTRTNPGTLNIGSGKAVSVNNLLDVFHGSGVNLKLEYGTRDEVAACVANTERLGQFVDVTKFQDPFSYLSRRIAS